MIGPSTGSISLPSNWGGMDIAAKEAYLKSLQTPTPAKAAEQAKWLREMASKFPGKGVKPTSQPGPVAPSIKVPPVATEESIKMFGNQGSSEAARLNAEYWDIVRKGAEAKAKAAQGAGAGAGAGAGIKAALGTKLGAAASFGGPILAGILGALAIHKTKKKFDQEIDDYTRESNKRHEELMKIIRKKREQKQNGMQTLPGKPKPETQPQRLPYMGETPTVVGLDNKAPQDVLSVNFSGGKLR